MDLYAVQLNHLLKNLTPITVLLIQFIKARVENKKYVKKSLKKVVKDMDNVKKEEEE